ncbi:type II toxin-antitoxin system MqsA family antitoxin [Rhodopila sp.]|uniref:type II toxin-antitoxin system MqsA family antitoxin n=1 Tax=Rhodopila sp. TaxID=2480087 RepID=UPI002C97C1DF|nr:type II toxin-antitoxin system MqsA family antitoxin [Rhodopila sp.]HVZ06699.1 type II toxin-antitoxin system MqsA family antitoxin [Rhodopila sp.]
MTNPVDPETGAPLRRDVRPLTLAYKGQSITVDMPGWYGDKPDEGIFEAEDMKVSDRALNRLKARTEGLLEPEEIRRIRKKLSLTQEAAGELIGGGPRAFQKYETGDLLPSRAISSALVLLDHDPKALTVLEARQAKTPARPPVPTPHL